MKKLIVLAILTLSAQSVFAGPDGIYGPDDRKDIFEVSSSLHLKLAQSTAGMIDVRMFKKGASATLFDLQGNPTLEAAENLCTSEKFGSQLLAPNCSGFLVGPDLLVTAGHCYVSSPRAPGQKVPTPQENCKSSAWVFDYNMKSKTTNPTKDISINNIYSCKSVVAAVRNNDFDYAIIRLDRKVVGRAPLKFRSTGKLSEKAPLVVIGHPNGLPTKIAGNGKVTLNSAQNFFSTNLDTFHGNSGSAVFDATSGQVEGILVMGKTDYVNSIRKNPKSCRVVNKCDDTTKNCSNGPEGADIFNGEVVIRIEKIAALISKALSVK